MQNGKALTFPFFMDYNHPYIKSLITNYEDEKKVTELFKAKVSVLTAELSQYRYMAKVHELIKSEPELAALWDQIALIIELKHKETLQNEIKHDCGN